MNLEPEDRRALLELSNILELALKNDTEKDALIQQALDQMMDWLYPPDLIVTFPAYADRESQ